MPAARGDYKREHHALRWGTRVIGVSLRTACGALLCLLLCTCASPIAHSDLYQDYSTEPNSSHPAVFDSGQTAILTYTPNDSARPTIHGGKSIINYNGVGRAAGYATAQLDDTVSYVDADWNFGSGGTASGALALGLYATAIPSGYLGDTLTPDSPAHVVFLDDHFEYGVWQNHVLTVIASVPYGRRFTTETQHVAVYVDKTAGRAWVLGPTGTVYGPFTHHQIKDMAAPFVTVEQFYDNASTDSRVEIRRWHASSRPVDPPVPRT
ncbi:hypothetical protein [Mycolicibacterium sp. 018/SC-01/001]|uniref:hypothetical protein n=1 Tax=Mycolicibacterium sp. 018/SC-01/001 TaxID=2592069 RepID=UPI00163D41EB|nr:hypothetical protein [Mycolicibacterium sp. 018/SC-01/001]